MNSKLTIVFLLFLACHSAKVDRSNIFENYLNDNFSLVIPEERQFYLILPKEGCQGSILSTVKQLEETIDTNCNIVIINSNSDHFSEFLDSHFTVHHDKKSLIEQLNLNITNVTLISTSNKKIDKITPTKVCDINKMNPITQLLSQCTGETKI